METIIKRKLKMSDFSLLKELLILKEDLIEYRGWRIKKSPYANKWFAKTKKHGSGPGVPSDLVKGFDSEDEAKKAIDKIED